MQSGPSSISVCESEETILYPQMEQEAVNPEVFDIGQDDRDGDMDRSRGSRREEARARNESRMAVARRNASVNNTGRANMDTVPMALESGSMDAAGAQVGTGNGQHALAGPLHSVAGSIAVASTPAVPATASSSSAMVPAFCNGPRIIIIGPRIFDDDCIC